MRMPLPEKQRWEEVMRDFLDGIEGELRPSPPLKSKADLSKFRNRLNRKRVEGGRNRFEQELEELLQSDRFLRRSTERHLAKTARAAIEEALVALENAEAVLAKYKRERREKKKERVS
jgi:hypothetical protein